MYEWWCRRPGRERNKRRSSIIHLTRTSEETGFHSQCRRSSSAPPFIKLLLFSSNKTEIQNVLKLADGQILCSRSRRSSPKSEIQLLSTHHVSNGGSGRVPLGSARTRPGHLPLPPSPIGLYSHLRHQATKCWTFVLNAYARWFANVLQAVKPFCSIK